MILNYCVACGCSQKDKLHQLQLMPRTDDEGSLELNSITLCEDCRSKINWNITRLPAIVLPKQKIEPIVNIRHSERFR